MWNSVVALVFVSLGRTLTMKIKKFILQLECDAYLLDKRFRETMFKEGSSEYKDTLKGWFCKKIIIVRVTNH